MDAVTTWLLFVLVIGGMTVGLGRAMWPRRSRPFADRTLRSDLVTGLAAARGMGANYQRTMERYLHELNSKPGSGGKTRC
ncbi:hypothetical protein [Haloechinothrix halophila]|uniref:hypothetical protein n=1 Tax=Haloechinothrix halophila TaxID=1069073 RepID=UPI0003F97775|nr:hypothetical protein [Haloechinothrix halophila]